MALLTLNSWPQSHAGIHFCSLKPLTLWYSVTADPGNRFGY